MQHYSPLQKYFHDLVFNNKIINKSLYEIEKLFLKKDLGLRDEYHVFITSLPRSGTTVLLNYLDSTNLFASLKYLNMPFIMSPNISKFLYRKNIKKKERLHNDGLKYDLESPEAFDEVFFSNNELYLKKEILNFINLILKSQKKKKIP